MLVCVLLTPAERARLSALCVVRGRRESDCGKGGLFCMSVVSEVSAKKVAGREVHPKTCVWLRGFRLQSSLKRFHLCRRLCRYFLAEEKSMLSCLWASCRR